MLSWPGSNKPRNSQSKIFMAESTSRVLIVDDEPDMVAGLRRILQRYGYNVESAGTADELLSHADLAEYLAIILDRRLPDAMADDLLPGLRERVPQVAIIMVTGFADLESALTAVRHGAQDYLIKPINPDALKTSLDRIVQRNESKRRLKESEQRFRLLVDGVQDYAIFMLDAMGNIVSWNEGAERIKGYTEQEVIGKHFSSLYTAQDLRDEKPANELRIAAQKGRFEEEGWRVRKDGSQFYANVVITPLYDQQGELCGYAKVTRDITERKRTQEKLLQSERLSAIGEAMAGLVHESRNALNRAQAALRMIDRRTTDRPELKPLVAGALEAQHDIQRLFEQVRQYAAPVNLEPATADLIELIDQIWEQIAPAREKRIARVAQHTSGVIPECIACAARLPQVFRNIFENSFAVCEDPVEIDVEYSPTELAGEPALQIAVRDNGPGLTSEQRDRVFDAFYTTKTHGTGLGMAIAKRIVEAHGGSIVVGDRHDRGAEFIVTLPTEEQS